MKARHHDVSDSELIRRLFYRFCRRVIWLPMKAFIRVQHYGAPDIGERSGGWVIAANHQSFLDPPLVGMVWPEPICYLARRSLFRIPGLRLLIRWLGAHPIRRGAVDSEAVRTVLRLLRKGEAVLMFPEGTRTHDGSVGDFKPGPAALAARCGVPVLPACIEGAFACWPRTRPLPRPGRVAVAFGRLVPTAEREPAVVTEEVRDQIVDLQAMLRKRLEGSE